MPTGCEITALTMALRYAGYTDTTVVIACPIYGVRTYTKAQFERVYNSRGCKAVVLE